MLRVCFPHLAPLLPNGPLKVVDGFLLCFSRARCLSVILQGAACRACCPVPAGHLVCPNIAQRRGLIPAHPLPALSLPSWESLGFVNFSKGFFVSSHAQIILRYAKMWLVVIIRVQNASKPLPGESRTLLPINFSSFILSCLWHHGFIRILCTEKMVCSVSHTLEYELHYLFKSGISNMLGWAAEMLVGPGLLHVLE